MDEEYEHVKVIWERSPRDATVEEKELLQEEGHSPEDVRRVINRPKSPPDLTTRGGVSGGGEV